MDRKELEEMAKAFKLEQERFLQKSARQMEMLNALIAQHSVPQAQQSSDAANHSFRGATPLADTPHHGVMNHDNAEAVDAILDVGTFIETGDARESLLPTADANPILQRKGLGNLSPRWRA